MRLCGECFKCVHFLSDFLAFSRPRFELIKVMMQ